MGKGGEREVGTGFTGKVEQGVIRVTVEVDAVLTEDTAKRKKANDEEEWS